MSLKTIELYQHNYLTKMRVLISLLFIILLHPIQKGFSKEVCVENLIIQADSTDENSTIKITSPNENTVWTIPDLVDIEWVTTNIGPEKSIRFFLVRDDTVVQELGSFINVSKKTDIELAKNIGSGDTYQVVGIELFPDNKLKIARFVTPHFSIRNKLAEERQKKKLLAMSTTEKKPSKAKQRTANTEGDTFNGRNISYTKELTFDSEKLNVSIWDHGRQDGDIVSIYLNGNAVISKHTLTYQKNNFEIRLDPNKANDLFLYAHNLGKSPPNTVSIEISDGKSSENIILNSDLKSCEAVLISVKK